jgi:hypothetical protein
MCVWCMWVAHAGYGPRCSHSKPMQFLAAGARRGVTAARDQECHDNGGSARSTIAKSFANTRQARASTGRYDSGGRPCIANLDLSIESRGRYFGREDGCRRRLGREV